MTGILGDAEANESSSGKTNITKYDILSTIRKLEMKSVKE